MKTDLSIYNNSAFQTGKPFWIRSCWFLINAIFVQSDWNPSSAFRIFLLRLFGAKIGKGVVIKPSVNIKYPWLLKIGNHVWIGEGVWIDNLAQVVIEDHVCISQGALLLTGNHNYKVPAFDLITRSIYVEEGTWIGAQSIICPGVICRSHSVLTVGSIATKDMEAYKIYTGNPAQPVKSRVIEHP